MLNTDFNGRGGVGNPRGLTHTSSLHLVRRPGPGSARGRGSLRQGRVLPGVDPHCRGGETHFSSLFLMCFAPSRVVTTAMPCPLTHGRRRYIQVQARSAAAAASVCTGGNAAIARSALCGVCKVRECVYQSAEGRRAPGAELTRPPACPGSTRGRASLDPRMSRVAGTTFIVSPRGFPTPPRPRASPRCPHMKSGRGV